MLNFLTEQTKQDRIEVIKSELRNVQKRLKNVRKTSSKIQALKKEDELIQRLMSVENDEVRDEIDEIDEIDEDEDEDEEKFDMNEIEFMK